MGGHCDTAGLNPIEYSSNSRQLQTIGKIRDVLPLHLLVFAAIYGLTLTLGYLLKNSSTGLEIWWPAAGPLLLYLAITSSRNWFRILAIAIALNAALFLLFNPGLSGRAILVGMVTAFEATLGALVIKHMVPSRWYARHSLEMTCYVLITALTISLVGAILMNVVVETGASTPSQSISLITEQSLRSVLGIIVIAPLVGSFVLRTAIHDNYAGRNLPLNAAGSTVAFVVFGLLIAYPPPVFGLSPWDRISISGILLLLILTHSAAREEPFMVAAKSFLTMLIVSVTCTMPSAPMTALILDEPHLLQNLVFMMLVVSLGAFIVAITRYEHTHMARLLELRKVGDNLIARMATTLATKNHEQLHEEIPKCLAKLGELLGGDRLVMLTINPENNHMEVIHAWASDPIMQAAIRSFSEPLTVLRDTGKLFDRGQTVFYRRDQLAPGSEYIELLEFIDAHAVAIAPMRETDEVNALLALVWNDGEARWSELQATHLQGAALVLSTALMRKHSLSATAAYQQQLRDLAARLTRLDDQIRRETALDLHDGAAQNLAVARFKVAQLKLSDEMQQNTVDILNELIDDALSQIRNIIDRMCPPILYELGLEMALKQFVREANRRTNMPIELRVLDELPILPEEQSTLLYRTSRELVTNAIKHADASLITLSLMRQDETLVLEVIDNGSGMEESDNDLAYDTEGGLGLFSLREMLSRLDGTMQVQSSASGTIITAMIPYPDEAWLDDTWTAEANPEHPLNTHGIASESGSATAHRVDGHGDSTTAQSEPGQSDTSSANEATSEHDERQLLG